MTTALDLDRIMEAASVALAEMDYLECEAQCNEALALARRANDWHYLARIFLPLQEARRQRRMIAADGKIRLGTASLEEDIEGWLSRLTRTDQDQEHAVTGGCILITAPHTTAAAGRLTLRARRERKFIEILFADPTPNDGLWRLRSFAGPPVTVDLPAPPLAWQDTWLDPANPADPPSPDGHGRIPGTWFLQTADSLGDRALELATQERGDDPIDRFDRLYACLEVFKDHEILHQRLADAARAVAISQS